MLRVVCSFTVLSQQRFVSSRNPSVLRPWISRTHSTILSLSSSTITTTSSQQLPKGLLKTIISTGNGRSIKLGDIVTVQYHAYVPTLSSSSSSNESAATAIIPVSIAQSSPKQKVIVGDGMMIPGWDAALLSMKVGEHSIVRIEDSIQYGYGSKGIPPIVPPNAILEMDIQILEAEDAPRFVSSGSVGGFAAGTSSSGGGMEDTLGVGKAGSGEWSLLDPSKPVRINHIPLIHIYIYTPKNLTDSFLFISKHCHT